MASTRPWLGEAWCPGFGWDRVNFPPGVVAAFLIWDENTVDAFPEMADHPPADGKQQMNSSGLLRLHVRLLLY